MREGFGKEFWKRQLEEGVDATPDDLETVIPGYLKGRSPEALAAELKTPDMFPLTEHPPQDMKARLVRDPQREQIKKELPGKLFSMAAALAASHMMPSPEIPTQETHSVQTTERMEVEAPDPQKEFSHKVTVDTGELAGKRVGDLFADYLGLPRGSIVPKTITVDFGKNLEVLWQHKIDFMDREIAKVKTTHEKKIATLTSQGDTDHIAKENESFQKKMTELNDRRNNVLKAKGEIVTGYREKWSEEKVNTMSLDAAAAVGDDVSQSVNASIQWEGMNAHDGPFPRLSTNAVEHFVKPLAEKVDGSKIFAYSLTELMPSVKNSEFNVAEYKFLLDNAGIEYVLSLPATHDHWLSFGMLQFTSLALRDDEEKTEGASKINKLLPEDMQIMGSVKYVNTLEGQLTAGHLFAVFNIGNLIQDILKDTNEKRKIQRLTVLYERTPLLEKGLLEFIAVAHHSPRGAIKGFEKWLDSGLTGKYTLHLNNVLGEYAIKSAGNFDQVKEEVN